MHLLRSSIFLSEAACEAAAGLGKTMIAKNPDLHPFHFDVYVDRFQKRNWHVPPNVAARLSGETGGLDVTNRPLFKFLRFYMRADI